MILADKEKREIKINGEKVDILIELATLIDELKEDFEDDEIMYAVKLGLTRGDIDKMSNLLIESIKKIIMEEDDEDTKENIL